MSTRTDKRLESIEGALTPKEAVLAWMTEAHALGSVNACVEALDGAPEEAFPLVRLTQQMEASVRRIRKGQPKDEVWQAVRRAVRDAGFLYYLCSDLNFRAIEHARANWLHIALVAEMLRSATEHQSTDRLGEWWEQAQLSAQRVYAQQGHVDAIARQYFDGTSPLFPEVAADVAGQVTHIERVIEIYNDGFGAVRRPRRKRDPVFPEPVDLVQLRASVAPAIEAEMALVVDLAKAEAWNLIGEWRNGLAQLGPHVWSTGR